MLSCPICKEKEQLTEKVNEAQTKYVQFVHDLGEHSCGGFRDAYYSSHKAQTTYEAAQIALATHVKLHGC